MKAEVEILIADDPREIEKCHELGCSACITKPVGYGAFVDVIHKLGLFLTVVETPNLESRNADD